MTVLPLFDKANSSTKWVLHNYLSIKGSVINSQIWSPLSFPFCFVWLDLFPRLKLDRNPVYSHIPAKGPQKKQTGMTLWSNWSQQSRLLKEGCSARCSCCTATPTVANGRRGCWAQACAGLISNWGICSLVKELSQGAGTLKDSNSGIHCSHKTKTCSDCSVLFWLKLSKLWPPLIYCSGMCHSCLSESCWLVLSFTHLEQEFPSLMGRSK